MLTYAIALSRPTCNMVARNLVSWTPPDGMARSLRSAQQTTQFDLVYGHAEYGPAIMDHLKTNTGHGLTEVYRLALADSASCGIIRARRADDGSIVGTVVLYTDRSVLSELIPGMRGLGESTGGMSSPAISPSVGEQSTLVQSLLLLGLRQVKRQGCNCCLLDYVRIT